jgi:EAL domain-containing protein (putative c-di-GMP-specific phosphodiesterase class I)
MYAVAGRRADVSYADADGYMHHERSAATPEQFADWLELHHILARREINPVFQPIISLHNHQIIGYESLSRVSHKGRITNPEELFEKAGKYGMTVQIERLCREIALERAAYLNLDGIIFLNVCPALLYAEDQQRGFTSKLLDSLGIDRSRIVFELTEKSLINDYDLFEKGVSHYRSQGYKIAIDDLGDGYAGLKMLSQITPDYVKLARFLVSSIDLLPAKQALVEAITCFSKRIGARVIAEGIERKEELSYLAGITVDYAQGYYLSKPASVPPDVGAFSMPPFEPVMPRCDKNRLCSHLTRH